jgi:hypothetical protein
MQALSNPFAYGTISFSLLVFASWCVGEGGEILGAKYDASIVGGLVIAWLNTSALVWFFVSLPLLWFFQFLFCLLGIAITAATPFFISFIYTHAKCQLLKLNCGVSCTSWVSETNMEILQQQPLRQSSSLRLSKPITRDLLREQFQEVQLVRVQLDELFLLFVIFG